MAASPMASSSGSQGGDENDPLELTSLDADSLFAALGAVEKAVPDLLLSVKPVLAHLTKCTERSAQLAEEGVEEYMNTLDKIQFVLRQTVYYLRETYASTTALRPPPAAALPTPFAASLAPAIAAAAAASAAADRKGKAKESAGAGSAGVADDTDGSDAAAAAVALAPAGGEVQSRQVEPELGLYGARMEARVLREMANVLGRIRAGQEGQGPLIETREEGMDTT